MEMSQEIFFASTFCDHKDWFIVNRKYQREEGVWSLRDKQHLIDSILKELDIPKIYLGKRGEKNYEIVDGQQRIMTIQEFREGEFALKGEISGSNLDGMKYEDLSQSETTTFDNYEFQCIEIEDYNDEEVRELFRKLQRGKPLNWSEKLNAYPGSIVPLTRDLARHNFFDKVHFSLKRYKAFGIVSRFLLLEKSGIVDVSPRYIRDFFRRNRDMREDSKTAKKTKRALNYLDNAFQSKTPELDREKWLINLYLLVSYLLKRFDMSGREKELKSYYIDCWREIERSRKTGKGPPEISRFVNANTSGTTSKGNIKTRFDYMVGEFLNKHPSLKLLDPKRSFDRHERIFIYRDQDKKCANCGREIKKFENFEIHHKHPHKRGGPTLRENAIGLCFNCHRKKKF